MLNKSEDQGPEAGKSSWPHAHALGPGGARNCARVVLVQYASTTKICEVYDADEAVAFALRVIHPQFEYPNHAQQTLGEFLCQYCPPPAPSNAATAEDPGREP